MPLEFALRPRFDLARPTFRRKRKLRFSPLALPIVAYWLAIAGATHALIRTATEEDGDERATARQRTSEIVEAAPNLRDVEPSSPLTVSSPSSGATAPTAWNLEPVPVVAATPEPTPARTTSSAFERAPDVEQTPALVPTADPGRALPQPAPPTRELAPPRHEPRLAESASLPSCESAAASANQSMDLGAAPGAPDLPREAFAPVLENGAYLAACALGSHTALEICAAIKDGKVVGVSVTSEPTSPAINACVRRAVAALRFPSSARLDITRTRFEAAR
jgi:hypothetical protein